MNPVKFNGVNVMIAEDQPEYQTLPAFVDEKGNVLTEWELSEAERQAIARGENIRISVLTFNKGLQPFLPYIQSVDYSEQVIRPESEKEKLLKPFTKQSLFDLIDFVYSRAKEENEAYRGFPQLNSHSLIKGNAFHEVLDYLNTKFGIDAGAEPQKEAYPSESEANPSLFQKKLLIKAIQREILKANEAISHYKAKRDLSYKTSEGALIALNRIISIVEGMNI